jgi:uncharacterized protein YbjQ (UPF0145 family)
MCSTVFNPEEVETCPTCSDDEPGKVTDDALAQAQDAMTSDDVLGKLAFHDDRAVREAVYANPNTPGWARNRLRPEVAPNEMPQEPKSSPRNYGPGHRRLYKPNPRVSTLDYLPGYEITEIKGTIYATTSTVGTKAQTDDGSVINRLEGRLEHAARESLDKLWKRAQEEGANAVVAVRLAAADSEGSGISSFRSSGVVLIGTAVTVVPAAGSDSPTSQR